MAKAEVISISELRDLENLADAGSEDAAQELRELSRVYSKRASERMRSLERSGINTAALQKAQYYLDDRGRTRFGAGKRASLDDVVENLEQARKFLTWQTSTIGGERERLNKMLKTMERNGQIGKFSNPKDRETFLNFLGSNAFADIKKYIGTNLSEAQQAIEAGAKVEDLEKIYNQYAEGEINNPLQVWDAWMESADE
jgi:hypothetical protein